jgi:hypothetical protein
MSIQIQGQGGTVAEADGAVFRALRVTLRPLEYGALGVYAFASLSGTMNGGLAPQEIWNFRWTDNTNFACVALVQLAGLAGSSTAFTAGFAQVDLYRTTFWAQTATDGFPATMTGNNSKLRTRMTLSRVNDIRSAGPSGLSTSSSKNITRIGQASFSIGTAASTIYVGKPVALFDAQEVGKPVVLVGFGGAAVDTLRNAAGEGLVARASVPATGTWQFGMRIVWSEVAEF